MENSSVFLIHKDRPVLFEDFNKTVKAHAGYIKSRNITKIVIAGDDTYTFLVNLFACIYLNIPVQLIPDKTKLKYAEGVFIDDVYDNEELIEGNIDENYVIEFLTSGSTAVPKVVKKSIKNLTDEAETIAKTFDFSNTSQFVTTSSLAHLFGFTFCFMLPFVLEKPINTSRILFPESIKNKNSVLISTPSFLSKIAKYDILPCEIPSLIISAGAKFNDFEYFENLTKVIEIYGSTETGIIGHKETSNSNFILFDNVVINENKIQSPFIYEQERELDDIIEVTESGIKVLSRKDRVVKIQEKRVSLSETEKIINDSEFIKESFTLQIGEKLACVAVLNNMGIDEFIEKGKLGFTKELKKYLKPKTDVIPQKWKFLDSIPKNQMGKIDTDYIKNLFENKLSLPLVVARNSEGIKLIFHRDSNFFKGHFPDYPIVPGVVQLYYASFFIKRVFGLNISSGQLKKIKFSNIMKPDENVILALQETNNSILYKYFYEDTIYSTGQFPKENIFGSEND